MAAEFGYTPKEVSDMTPGQIDMMLADLDGSSFDPSTGRRVRRFRTAAEADAYIASRLAGGAA